MCNVPFTLVTSRFLNCYNMLQSCKWGRELHSLKCWHFIAMVHLDLQMLYIKDSESLVGEANQKFGMEDYVYT